MDHRLIEGLMEVIAPLIKTYVDERIAKEVTPLHAQIKAYEAREPLKGEPGKDADPEVVSSIVAAEVAKVLPAAVAAIPVPENGKDADPAHVEMLVRLVVGEEVGKIERPKDGKDADPAIVAAMVADEVEKAVAAIERPADGKDGAPGPAGQSVTVDDLEPVVDEMVKAAVVLEMAKIVVPEGKAGEPGKSVTIDDVRPVLEQLVEALPPAANGKDADPVEVAALIVEDVAKLIPVPADGKSVTIEDVLPAIDEAIEKKIAALPKAKDGVDGRDGKDGVGMAGALLGRAGELVLTLSDGTAKDLGVIIGKDGEPGLPGKDGRDGFSLKDFDTELLEDGRTVLLKFGSGDVLETHELVFAVPLDRGVFKEGESYQRGDGVTFGGSWWVAQKDAPEGRPQDGSKDWRLAVKRGRDGKDGVVRTLPPQGPVKA